MTKLENKIFAISNQRTFDEVCLEVFQYQYHKVPIYKQFCDYLKVAPEQVNQKEEIPFLPIQFFKSNKIYSASTSAEVVFSSSGTTGQTTSKHYVNELNLYKKSFRTTFKQFYGNIKDYAVLALLPAYLEREGSSLIFMAQDLIAESNHAKSGFYLNNLEELVQTLKLLESQKQKTLLLGVSFALLDLAEQFPMKLEHTIIMETGGMKGRRKEMIREELHQVIGRAFNLSNIHSEYGMTELLSQAYSKGEGIFKPAAWMDILIRDPEEPTRILKNGKTGGINVIDLANVHSCSFIATQDLGSKLNTNEFRVIGRFDASDIRGCNLLLL
ncbi:acyl transferase [uncultured Mesonia sp.]|uniref:LuxE/PaaK family acyltransferase n=1 Tax=uncultured Mesonia sp. TaxID=399731 RepID=UPI00374F015C